MTRIASNHGGGTGGGGAWRPAAWALTALAVVAALFGRGAAGRGTSRPAAGDTQPAAAQPAAAQPAAVDRRPVLLAHGSDGWFWLARIRDDRATGGTAGLRTELYARPAQSADGLVAGAWVDLQPVGQRAVSLAHRGRQLAVLLDDGQWTLVSPESARPGSALPVPGARLVALSDGPTPVGEGRQDVWAVARIPGGVAALRAATPAPATTATQPASSTAPSPTPTTSPTTAAATSPAAATAPATVPADAGSSRPPGLYPAPSIGPVTPVAPAPVRGPEVLSLIYCGPDGWIGETDVPATVARPGDAVSLGIAGDSPYLAVRRPGAASDDVGAVRVYRWSQGRWSAVGGGETGATIPLAAGRVFHLLTGSAAPVLWAGGAADADPDTLVLFGRDGPATVALDAPAGSPTAQRAAAYATGKVRAVFEKGDKHYEQIVDPATGQPAGPPAPIVFQVAPAVDPQWVRFAVATIAMGFSIFASFRRREEIRAVTPETLAGAGVRLAPMGLRVLAGLVDAVPVVAGVAVAIWRDGPKWEESWPGAAFFWLGVVVYVGHTLASELLTGRTLGKAVCGLRVVALDGSAPGRAQAVARNLLRVIDAGLFFAPLVLVLLSPLRQRAADVAAGTLVVQDAERAPAETPAETSGEAPADQRKDEP